MCPCKKHNIHEKALRPYKLNVFFCCCCFVYFEHISNLLCLYLRLNSSCLTDEKSFETLAGLLSLVLSNRKIFEQLYYMIGKSLLIDWRKGAKWSQVRRKRGASGGPCILTVSPEQDETRTWKQLDRRSTRQEKQADYLFSSDPTRYWVRPRGPRLLKGLEKVGLEQ